MHRSTPIMVLLTTALVAAALPGVAADSHDDAAANGNGGAAADARSQAEQWVAVKDALANGAVADARTTFDATFTPAATHHALASEYAHRAFDALDDLNDTSSPAWAAWAQVVDKSTYAIAFANVDAALAEGDVDNASQWFGLLEAKFTKDAELTESKTRFANLTEANAADARTTLTRELTDLMQAKVHKEAAETPGLLVADPVTAAKEAGEALGYFLTIEPGYRAAFGDDAAVAALHVLDDLVEETLAADEEDVEHYALEARNVAARHAIATADTAKLDAYTTVTSALKADEDVATARAAYVAHLQHAAQETDAATDARITAALDDAEAALAAEDALAFSLARQTVEKSLYKVAFDAFVHEAMEGETDEALASHLILQDKFGWTMEDAGTAAAGRLAAANAVSDADLAAAKADAYATFFGKVREEVEEVFIHWEDPATAQNKAIEGVVYYTPLHADVAERLGDAVAEEIALELDALFEATKAGDRARADAAAEEIEKLLVQYEADGQDVTELDRVVSALKGKIAFVDEEYRGYYEALEIGDEKEAAVELGETKAFLAGARQQFEQNADAFEAAAGADYVADVLARMDGIAVLVEDLVPYEDVQTEATALIGLLDSIVGVTGSEPETIALRAVTEGDRFFFEQDGVENPTLALEAGKTYTVELEAVGTHNLRFHAPVDAATEMVTDDATELTFTIPEDFTGTLAYWCEPHQGLGMAGVAQVAGAGRGETVGASTLRLEAPRLEDAGQYSVRLVGEGFPQDGVAYQFALAAPAGLAVEDVELELADASAVDVADDGASARFNGASTGTLADGETFGRILFTVTGDVPESAEFAFTVEEFADANGKPWDVTFEGTTVSFANVLDEGDTTVSGDDTPGNDTPAPAAVFALVALAGVALLARRRGV